MTNSLAPFLGKCNGGIMDGERLPEPVAKAVVAVLPAARTLFKGRLDSNEISNREYFLGSRFETDADILNRIWAAVSPNSLFGPRGTVEQVQHDPLGWALDALRDCASADYYYTFEKDYGDN